jgi:choice-of-anchor A domain-containing protein
LGQNLLYAGGTLYWNKGTPFSGNVVARTGSGLGASVNSSLSSYNCGVVISALVPSVVGVSRQVFRSASTYFGTLADTTDEVKVNYGTLQVSFKSADEPIQVVSIAGSSLGGFSSISLGNYDAAKSFLIINLRGRSGIRIEGKSMGGLVAERTLFNLPDHAGDLVIQGTSLRGSLLAVDSDIVAGSGQVTGQVIVRSSGNFIEYSPPLSPFKFENAICVGLPLSSFPIDNTARYEQDEKGIADSFTAAPGGPKDAGAGLGVGVIAAIVVGVAVVVLAAVGVAVWYSRRKNSLPASTASPETSWQTSWL